MFVWPNKESNSITWIFQVKVSSYDLYLNLITSRLHSESTIDIATQCVKNEFKLWNTCTTVLPIWNTCTTVLCVDARVYCVPRRLQRVPGLGFLIEEVASTSEREDGRAKVNSFTFRQNILTQLIYRSCLLFILFHNSPQTELRQGVNVFQVFFYKELPQG